MPESASKRRAAIIRALDHVKPEVMTAVIIPARKLDPKKHLICVGYLAAQAMPFLLEKTPLAKRLRTLGNVTFRFYSEGITHRLESSVPMVVILRPRPLTKLPRLP